MSVRICSRCDARPKLKTVHALNVVLVNVECKLHDLASLTERGSFHPVTGVRSYHVSYVRTNSPLYAVWNPDPCWTFILEKHLDIFGRNVLTDKHTFYVMPLVSEKGLS